MRRDIDEIPLVLQRIQDEWNDGSMNRLSAWTLERRLKARPRDLSLVPAAATPSATKLRPSSSSLLPPSSSRLRLVRSQARLVKRAKGDLKSNQVDLLVTGCEVSLWLGEQFAADLSTCLTLLNVKCVSANKLLGLLGQDFPAPQTGHGFSEGVWDLHDTVVLIVRAPRAARSARSGMKLSPPSLPPSLSR